MKILSSCCRLSFLTAGVDELDSYDSIVTRGRQQWEMLFTIDKHGSKIDRNSVFNCHLSPVGGQMTIENSISNDFLSTFVDSIDVFDCRLPGVIVA